AHLLDRAWWAAGRLARRRDDAPRRCRLAGPGERRQLAHRVGQVAGADVGRSRAVEQDSARDDARDGRRIRGPRAPAEHVRQVDEPGRNAPADGGRGDGRAPVVRRVAGRRQRPP
ncbi:MAG: hypothetical protein AVDCRST_MAG85-769, partial [uncultured Solirubrobacteraceae bacterium]